MTDEELALLDEALDAEENLNSWEYDFVVNLDENYRRHELSPKQTSKLKDIVENL